MAEGIENIMPDESATPHGVRRKRRYKYRYKKKKRSGKKRVKKFLEFLMWLVVIAAFITSLVILVRQMEINDEAVKKKRKKSTITLPVNPQQVCKLQAGYIISQNGLI
jgi:hypothetical protein